jgi:serpin B
MILLLVACNATNTGNPEIDNAPQGVELVRSKAKRAPNPKVSAAEQERLGSGVRDFTFDLYSQLKTDQGNLFYSPYSIAVAVAMTYAGSKGATKAEMGNALHFELSEPTLHVAFNATNSALEGRAHQLAGESDPASGTSASTGDGFQLRLVNAAFGSKGTQFVDDYLDLLALDYGAGMFRADFAAQPDKVREAINAWIAAQTLQRIQNVLPDGSIGADVSLVPVNAIYFKASWLDPFDAARTEPATFHARLGDASVQMMHGGANSYLRRDGYQALELPYISPDVRMLFILPDTGNFEAVEARLDRALFDDVRAKLARYTVDLKVPRFSFEMSVSLKQPLRALGVKLAFDDADLSGIAGMPGELFIDDIYHKAFVAVDEQGTEAAAATAVVARKVSAPPPAEFILDRPFMFFVYDQPTGQILFAGRLVDPR